MSNPRLFTPVKVGGISLSHRIAMAPMTRFRNSDSHVPLLPLAKDYYEQRASVPGTLLITEATLISPRAGGYPNVPGIWSEEQITAWKEITDAVHQRGSHIYMQLWALGRVANAEVVKAETGGKSEVVSSSAVPEKEGGVVPRAMSEEEIWDFVGDYVSAAKNAVFRAGFDGVEIHGANGYLVDQFNQDTCNQRTDGWGGSVENRARFALEVIRGVVDAVGAERTAIRYSPWSTFQGMRMKDPIPTFDYLAQKTAEFKLAYVHVVESRVSGNADIETTDELDFFVKAYGHASPIMIAGGYGADSAKEAVDTQYKDYDVIIGIGRPFTSNPDLPFKVKQGIPLRAYNREYFYLPKDPKGFADYDFSEEFKAVQAAA